MRQRSARPNNSVLVKPAKPSQRQRLVDAMIELAAESGYESVSIAQISAKAGVSSATFYEQFKGKEDCLLAAFSASRARVFKQIHPVAPDSPWLQAARDTMEGLFSGLQADPDAGRLLFVEALAGGPRMREKREAALADYEQQVEQFMQSRPAGTDTLDIPVAALEGSRRYIVSRHLRTQSEDRLPALVDDVLIWMRSYACSAEQERWSVGPRALRTPAGPVEAPALEPDGPGSWPARLPRGRHGLPASVVARSQRTRIIGGTCEVMMVKGFASTTVADIVAAAGVSRDVFYEHFADKQNAYMEAQQYAGQYIVDICAAAYFAAPTWPLRIWKALGTLLDLIAAHPAIAHLRVVECYAAGATAIRSTEEVVRAATIFLEEGFNYNSEAGKLPRVCAQTIAGAILEVIYRCVSRGEAGELPRRLPQLTYIAIAPFTGREQAIALIEQAAADDLEAGGA